MPGVMHGGDSTVPPLRVGTLAPLLLALDDPPLPSVASLKGDATLMSAGSLSSPLLLFFLRLSLLLPGAEPLCP